MTAIDWQEEQPLSHQPSAPRAVIYTGGNLGPWSLSLARRGDYLIGADKGAYYLVQNGIAPHLALGDFDSVDADALARIRAEALETAAFDAVDKDWSDTELALREALARGYRDIVIAGGLGSRFDHSLANVQLLAVAAQAGATAMLVDEHNEIRLLTESGRLNADERYPYVSLLPLTPEVTGVTLTGFAYPLNEATLRHGMSLGVSNLLTAEEGLISLRSGSLLVIRSRD
ncbi:thiamine diphosphokinase [Cohnella rhizosphaerae]|uniref:Thiamine diphosphokinase n=1 Tax=Cohnella rhizosphaerae TaxID=1457232 RepID=A0A9X4KXZ3_9BACL|nr:thiamine diphosphokinase [Cohnella rhizosphaerae]MDG0812927.1 thiamine diphosphokinase [Cohnella rhizosphaerae]